ncbi:SRPBCC family protein [Agromyces sp. SYSU T00194]|uniref:SRPBCC family protein n=1 Tax=Agromyces chitinivorans TaxID=3158560 RepID=UPI0033988136
MLVEATRTVQQPVAKVWDFAAVHHEQNHPRWDHDISLRKLTDGPVGVGTVYERRNTRFGIDSTGTTEVVEFDPERAMTVVTAERGIEFRGIMRLAQDGEGRTSMTLGADMPGLDDEGAAQFRPMLERSITAIESLMAEDD